MYARILKIAATTCVLIALWQMFAPPKKSNALAPIFEPPPPLCSEPWRPPAEAYSPPTQTSYVVSNAQVTPLNTPVAPHAQSTPPYAQTTPSYAQPATTYAQTTPPYAQTASQYAQVAPEPEFIGPLLIASADSAPPASVNITPQPAPSVVEEATPPTRLPMVDVPRIASAAATNADITPVQDELPPPATTAPPVATDPAATAAPATDAATEAATDTAAPPASPAAPAAASSEKKEKLGEEPPNTAIDIFRQSAVLLPVGVLEWECGLNYTLFEDPFLTILPNSAIVPQRTSSRTFLASTSLRYGYNEVLQPYITVPAGMSTVETANNLSDFSNDEYGIGDVSFGASYLLRDGRDECADVVFGLSCVAPTGEANFLSIVPGNASLGNGFWILSPSLTWTRTYDPLVVYATASYVHRFEREHFGVPVQPGEEFDIGYGAGFAINDNFTYSLQFQWAHQFDTKIDGQSINDSGADIASIRQGAIFRITPQRFFEAFFANGITDNSPEISTGFLLTQRY